MNATAQRPAAHARRLLAGGRQRAKARQWLAAVAIGWLVPAVGAIDIDDVMSGIEMVESSGRDIGLHPDGVTYGRYGVTYMAVRELQRIRWVRERTIDLSDPATNKRMARLYLTYLKERYGSWWAAVRQYNPRSSTYARKVWSAMDRRNQEHVATR